MATHPAVQGFSQHLQNEIEICVQQQLQDIQKGCLDGKPWNFNNKNDLYYALCEVEDALKSLVSDFDVWKEGVSRKELKLSKQTLQEIQIWSVVNGFRKEELVTPSDKQTVQPVSQTATGNWVYNDGGRKEAGYQGLTGDCACRAIAIAAELPYQVVYDKINELAKNERTGRRKKKKSHARTGVFRSTSARLLKELGFKWKPTMLVGSGCKIHLKASELPKGRLVVKVSRHLCAVIDGVIHDTHDCSRNGTRCVYGYYYKDKGD